MIPANFDYLRVDSVEGALEALQEHGDEAKLIAGGHSLLPLMKFRLSAPAYLVDINRLDDLKYVREENGSLVIGALTRHSDIEANSLVKGKCWTISLSHPPRRRPTSSTPWNYRRRNCSRRPSLRYPISSACTKRDRCRNRP